MTTLEEIETALSRLSAAELARVESLVGELRHHRLPTAAPATARDLLARMRQRATAGTLLDEAALDRLDAAQAAPRRSPDRWAPAQGTED